MFEKKLDKKKPIGSGYLQNSNIVCFLCVGYVIIFILGSIISGFKLPLKKEHTDFLNNILLPLHQVNIFLLFFALNFLLFNFSNKNQKKRRILKTFYSHCFDCHLFAQKIFCSLRCTLK